MRRKIKQLIVGAALSILPLFGLAQQRYDVQYQRIQTEDEKRIIEFYQNNPGQGKEQSILYDYNTKNVTDISVEGEFFIVESDKYKLDSLHSTSRNIVLSHSHNPDVKDIRKDFIKHLNSYENPNTIRKKFDEITDDTIDKRIWKEIPSDDDIRGYYKGKIKYGINNHYIYVSGNLYSFSIVDNVSIDSVLRSYDDIMEFIKHEYCEVYDKPGTCVEPNIKEITKLINEFTPITLLDHNTEPAIVSQPFDKADSVLSEYFKDKSSEHQLMYNMNNNTLTDITSISNAHQAKINIQKLDSVLQKSTNVVFGHNHTSGTHPMSWYPSDADIRQLMAITALYPDVNNTFRIYPKDESKSIEYHIPIFLNNLSSNKERNIQYIKNIALAHSISLYNTQNIFENSKNSKIQYKSNVVKIVVRGNK